MVTPFTVATKYIELIRDSDGAVFQTAENVTPHSVLDVSRLSLIPSGPDIKRVLHSEPTISTFIVLGLTSFSTHFRLYNDGTCL